MRSGWVDVGTLLDTPVTRLAGVPAKAHARAAPRGRRGSRDTRRSSRTHGQRRRRHRHADAPARRRHTRAAGADRRRSQPPLRLLWDLVTVTPRRERARRAARHRRRDPPGPGLQAREVPRHLPRRRHRPAPARARAPATATRARRADRRRRSAGPRCRSSSAAARDERGLRHLRGRRGQHARRHRRRRHRRRACAPVPRVSANYRVGSGAAVPGARRALAGPQAGAEPRGGAQPGAAGGRRRPRPARPAPHVRAALGAHVRPRRLARRLRGRRRARARRRPAPPRPGRGIPASSGALVRVYVGDDDGAPSTSARTALREQADPNRPVVVLQADRAHDVPCALASRSTRRTCRRTSIAARPRASLLDGLFAPGVARASASRSTAAGSRRRATVPGRAWPSTTCSCVDRTVGRQLVRSRHAAPASSPARAATSTSPPERPVRGRRGDCSCERDDRARRLRAGATPTSCGRCCPRSTARGQPVARRARGRCGSCSSASALRPRSCAAASTGCGTTSRSSRCDDWVIPYIADARGHEPRRRRWTPRGQRLDVANTIYYRRRKGTLGLARGARRRRHRLGEPRASSSSARSPARGTGSTPRSGGPPTADDPAGARLPAARRGARRPAHGDARGRARRPAQRRRRGRHRHRVRRVPPPRSTSAAGRARSAGTASPSSASSSGARRASPSTGRRRCRCAGCPGHYAFDPTGRQIALLQADDRAARGLRRALAPPGRVAGAGAAVAARLGRGARLSRDAAARGRGPIRARRSGRIAVGARSAGQLPLDEDDVEVWPEVGRFKLGAGTPRQRRGRLPLRAASRGSAPGPTTAAGSASTRRPIPAPVTASAAAPRSTCATRWLALAGTGTVVVTDGLTSTAVGARRHRRRADRHVSSAPPTSAAPWSGSPPATPWVLPGAAPAGRTAATAAARGPPASAARTSSCAAASTRSSVSCCTLDPGNERRSARAADDRGSRRSTAARSRRRGCGSRGRSGTLIVDRSIVGPIRARQRRRRRDADDRPTRSSRACRRTHGPALAADRRLRPRRPRPPAEPQARPPHDLASPGSSPPARPRPSTPTSTARRSPTRRSTALVRRPQRASSPARRSATPRASPTAHLGEGNRRPPWPGRPATRSPRSTADCSRRRSRSSLRDAALAVSHRARRASPHHRARHGLRPPPRVQRVDPRRRRVRRRRPGRLRPLQRLVRPAACCRASTRASQSRPAHPLFTSRRFGEAGYAQLSRGADAAILGSDDRGHAEHPRGQPRRLRDGRRLRGAAAGQGALAADQARRVPACGTDPGADHHAARRMPTAETKRGTPWPPT